MARKLPVPQAPEMGFGAVALDGSVVLNEPIIEAARISKKQIHEITSEVAGEVRRRALTYAGHDTLPRVSGRTVILVDDGLATGYTALAVSRMLRRCRAHSTLLAIPVCPLATLATVEPQFDSVCCLIAQQAGDFAVASYYDDFHDLTDHEVIQILMPR